MRGTVRFATLVLVGVLAACGPLRKDTIVIGSKNFSEQALLGEILAQQIETRTHLAVIRHFYLAGSYICQQALLSGRIDSYVEYTGTALTAILHDPMESDPAAVFGRVEREYKQRFGFDVMPSLGFDNTFALVVRGEDARRLKLKTISDAARYADRWRAGFGYEFMERPDGFPGLARMYGLRFRVEPRILDLGLLYRALLDHQVDLVAGNSTDGLLAARDLVILEDDKHYFPPYEAVPVVREEAVRRHPEVRAAIASLAGRISDQDMRSMNYEVDGKQRDIAEVAREFLARMAPEAPGGRAGRLANFLGAGVQRTGSRTILGDDRGSPATSPIGPIGLRAHSVFLARCAIALRLR